MDQKAFVLDFLRQHHLAVLATADETGKPEAAVLGFAETDAFELIFNTSNTTLKFQNLQKNPRVAVVIGWDKGQTVQYEGTVREVSGDEAARYREILYAKNPASRQHEQKPDERHFVIAPMWLRYSDINQDPAYRIEWTF